MITTVSQDEVPAHIDHSYARGFSLTSVRRTETGAVELTYSPVPSTHVLWVPLAATPSLAVGVAVVPPMRPA